MGVREKEKKGEREGSKGERKSKKE